jgi:hypothetical protein
LASALVGPLTVPRGLLGVRILIAAPGERFTLEHEDLATALLEPFSAALENDLRLREVVALRAAAEADKESLLHRLGRKEVIEAEDQKKGISPINWILDLSPFSRVPGDRSHGLWYLGRSYLFRDETTLQKFETNPRQYADFACRSDLDQDEANLGRGSRVVPSEPGAAASKSE